ncbi:MAG: 50S ribosomal protein L7/L12 [Candidatus Omnitrophica bacterium]|nr:50S ribosomal protein L7/L12 [Candidatus Omnitrophota bacterium]
MSSEQATAVETEVSATKKEKKEGKAVSDKLQGILKTIEELTVLELADLVKALEDRFGVSAAAAVAVAAPGAGGAAAAGGAAPQEEKTSFTVILASSGDKKIQVIKEIRAVTNLGLKEAKDLVEGAPKTVKEGVNKEEADKIKKILEEQGAKVEIK